MDRRWRLGTRRSSRLGQRSTGEEARQMEKWVAELRKKVERLKGGPSIGGLGL